MSNISILQEMQPPRGDGHAAVMKTLSQRTNAHHPEPNQNVPSATQQTGPFIPPTPKNAKNLSSSGPNIPQTDGPGDYRSNTTSNHFNPQLDPRRQTNAPHLTRQPQQPAAAMTSMGLLPWCTTQMRLSDEQAIALSDLGGNLREVMLVALAAAADGGARVDLERAVGLEAADAIVEFWSGEYAMD